VEICLFKVGNTTTIVNTFWITNSFWKN